MAKWTNTVISDKRIDFILILLELLYLCSKVSPYGQILRAKSADREHTLLDKVSSDINNLKLGSRITEAIDHAVVLHFHAFPQEVWTRKPTFQH